MNSFGKEKFRSRAISLGFAFLKLGPVQTAQGPLGAGAGASLRLIAASMGPGFQEWDPQISNWDPQLNAAIYWA
jgi:hypothetical protein